MSAQSIFNAIQQWRTAAPSFRPTGLRTWSTEGLQAGWLKPALATRLLESGLFTQQGSDLALNPDLGGPLSRSHALQCLAEVLNGEGWISGWRGETHDWLDDWGRVRFSLERGAFRPLGLRSRAIHVNGYIDDGGLWIARRASHKAVDPGRLDNLTAGGIASRETPEDCLLRELAEEAGIPSTLAIMAQPVGVIRSQRIEADGVHDELLYCYDLALPPDFVPRNTDHEVASFELMRPDRVADCLPAMTQDAALVTVGWLGRWLSGEV